MKPLFLARHSFCLLLGAFFITAAPTSAQVEGHEKPRDLLENSDFLSHNEQSTLVPKHSILHIPKHFRDRIKFQKGNKIVIWPTFFRNNRDWIKTIEVTREQALGKEFLADEVIEKMEKAGFLVVATYKNGPVSVLPPKEPKG